MSNPPASPPLARPLHTASQHAVQRYLELRSEPRADGCILWTGCVSKAGYGTARIGGASPAPVTRIAYEAHFGAVPPNNQVRTTCGNKVCINPEHLKLHPTFRALPPKAAKWEAPTHVWDGTPGKDPFA